MKTESECGKFAEEILTAGQALSADAAGHVKNCPACAAQRAEVMRFAMLPQEREVPEKLDRAILDHAAAALRKRSFRYRLFRRWIPCGAAAAAAAVLCMIVLTPESDFPAPGTAAPVIASVSAGNDWSAFEREAFDLNQELTSCQNVMAAWQTNME